MRALGLILLLILLLPAAAQPLWGPNLLPNAGCEEADAQGRPTGWTLGNTKGDGFTLLTSPEACAGTRALLIERKPGAVDVNAHLISPFVKAKPGWYIFSFWYRHDLQDKEQPYKLIFVERRTGVNGEQRTGVHYYYYSHRPSVSGEWNSAFLLFHVREGDTGIGIRMDAGHVPRRMYLDALQIRQLQPPPVTNPPFPTLVMDGYGVERVKDPAALTGLAWQAAEGVNPRGTKIMGQTRQSETPGLYLVTYRFKQIAPGGDNVLGISLSGGGGMTMETVSAADFTGAGYQEFPVYFFYPFGGGAFYTYGWQGKGTYRFDYLDLKLQCPITYQEAWGLIYDGVDVDKVLPAPPKDGVTADVWLARGLHTELTGILPALESAGLTVRETPQKARELETPMPNLHGTKLVVIAGTPATALSATEQYAVKRFVEGGGGLIVLGGLYGYGHGGMPGSLLEDLLPVKTKTFDLRQLPAGTMVTGRDDQPLGEIAWVHDIALKPGGTLAARAGDAPVVVTAQAGKGCVVAITGTILGTPKSPFWESPAWQAEMNRLVKWVAGQP
ncbi:MAG: hypothetical protein ACYC7E_15335 [Armatimonadota bacterium]